MYRERKNIFVRFIEALERNVPIYNRTARFIVDRHPNEGDPDVQLEPAATLPSSDLLNSERRSAANALKLQRAEERARKGLRADS
jgi:hypothetical protein